jgi:hypothetical protein
VDPLLQPAVLAKTVVLPGLVGLLFAASAGRWKDRRFPWMAAGIALAYAAAHWLHSPPESLWPVDLTQRLPHLALLVCLVALLPPRPRCIALLAWVAVAVYALVAPLSHSFEGVERVYWFGVTVGATATSLGLCGSVFLAQLAGALATALGASAGIQWRKPDPAAARGSAWTGCALFGAFLVVGVLLLEVPVAIVIALAAAWLVCLLAAALPGEASRKRVFVFPLAAAIPAAIAVWLAYAEANSANYHYDY